MVVIEKKIVKRKDCKKKIYVSKKMNSAVI